MASAPPSRKEALTAFIQQIHGRPVVVKLNSGVDYRGMSWTPSLFHFDYLVTYEFSAL